MTRFSLEFKYIKGFGRIKRVPFYEIRLLFLRKVKFLLGFFDIYNNFIFFKFNLFFFYFIFWGISVEKILKNLVFYDFLFLVITGYKMWLFKNNFHFPNFIRKKIFFRLNIILNKILSRRFNSFIVGFTWGKLLYKQLLVLRRLDNTFLKKLHKFLQET